MTGSVITGLDPTLVNPANPFPLFVIQVRKEGGNWPVHNFWFVCGKNNKCPQGQKGSHTSMHLMQQTHVANNNEALATICALRKNRPLD